MCVYMATLFSCPDLVFHLAYIQHKVGKQHILRASTAIARRILYSSHVMKFYGSETQLS